MLFSAFVILYVYLLYASSDKNLFLYIFCLSYDMLNSSPMRNTYFCLFISIIYMHTPYPISFSRMHIHPSIHPPSSLSLLPPSVYCPSPVLIYIFIYIHIHRMVGHLFSLQKKQGVSKLSNSSWTKGRLWT